MSMLSARGAAVTCCGYGKLVGLVRWKTIIMSILSAKEAAVACCG